MPFLVGIITQNRGMSTSLPNVAFCSQSVHLTYNLFSKHPLFLTKISSGEKTPLLISKQYFLIGAVEYILSAADKLAELVPYVPELRINVKLVRVSPDIKDLR